MSRQESESVLAVRNIINRRRIHRLIDRLNVEASYEGRGRTEGLRFSGEKNFKAFDVGTSTDSVPSVDSSLWIMRTRTLDNFILHGLWVAITPLYIQESEASLATQ